MNIITRLSGWVSSRFSKKDPMSPFKTTPNLPWYYKLFPKIMKEDTSSFEDQLKDLIIEKKKVWSKKDEIPVDEYVKKLDFLKLHLSEMSLWIAVSALYHNQKIDPKKLIKMESSFGNASKNSTEKTELIKKKIYSVNVNLPEKSVYRIEQEKFQDDFRNWLKEEKDTLMKDANTDLFIEFVKDKKDMTDEILDHVRVSATWINGVFVNHQAWQKEVNDVRTFLERKSLTSEETNTI